MFNYHDFVLTALLDSIGIMTDAWVRVQAIAHHEKGVLTEANLAQIDTKIVEKNTPPVEPEDFLLPDMEVANG